MNDIGVEAGINKRQQALLAHICSHGSGQVDSLADRFRVTPQTIRRDLNTLCERRLLQRVHGGAVAPRHGKTGGQLLLNLDYATRQCINPAGKALIGNLTAGIIPNEASLFINIGTTTEQVARHLTGHRELLVITNNINIANTLRRFSAISVMTAGGLVRHADGGIVGDATEEFIDRFKVDYAVIGCSALEEDGTILEFDVREVRVAQAIMRNSRSVILVADRNKFARKAPVRLGSLEQVDYFVTDEPPPGEVRDLCDSRNVRVLSGS
jgi:DeoR family glycerol-3-phosphate regulon repressor